MSVERISEIDGVLIRDYNGPNWFTERGVFLKRKAIEKKGIPDLANCKFITATVDPNKFAEPKAAYEAGKDEMRRFLGKLRKALGCKLAFAWKLEFQENGYPHWHLIIVYRKFIPLEVIKKFNAWWGLGRVNTKRIKKSDFDYLFKYVSKGVWSESNEDGINLPDWILDYVRIDENGRPSSTIRFWQTGGGFHAKSKNADLDSLVDEDEDADGQKRYSRVSYTLRQQIEIWNRKLTFFALDTIGKIRASKQIVVKKPWSEFFQCMVHKLINGEAAYVDGIWICRIRKLESLLNLWQLKQIKRIELRRLSPGMA